jgi:prepilin-type processing-associated H-X9-DG protein
MNNPHKAKKSRAFSLIDLLIGIAVVMFLAALMLPYLAKPNRGHNRSRISCVNRLKQVGLSFRVWAGDNGDKYPMSVSTNQGGSMEWALMGDTILTFQVMSNELSTPKILLCPSDSRDQFATNFLVLTAANLSYFVGVDANETNPSMFLSGDRHITNGTRIRGGLVELTTNRLSGWTGEIHQNAGNIGLADGSVQQLSTPSLRAALENSGVATNRLAIP